MKTNFTNQFCKRTLLSEKKTFLKVKHCLLVTMFLMCFSLYTKAQTYPFSLPGTVTAKINVNTGSKANAKTLLLGASVTGYTSTEDKNIVRYLDPITVRFPSGLFSNFYNYQTDKSSYINNDGVKDPYLTSTPRLTSTSAELRNSMDRNQITGYPGMKGLYNELGFNMLWTYNLNFDSNARSIARMKSNLADGLPVNYIELGNELFWAFTRSGEIPDAESIYGRSVSLAAALKRENPGVKISLPLGFNPNDPNHTDYNRKLTVTKNYFDAITLHKYVEQDKDADPQSAAAYKRILTARKEHEESANFVRSFAPGKKIWLTEWSVSCGFNAASYLGMADVYVYLFENQNIYDRAEYFIANQRLNPLYVFKNSNGTDATRTVANLKKTGFGAVYEATRSVFQNSVVMGSYMNCNANLNGVSAVTAKAVTKNGKTMIYAVNKTSKNVVLSVDFDGLGYYGYYRLNSIKFNNLSDDRLYGKDENVLKFEKAGTGPITLPPYSINVISEIPFKGSSTVSSINNNDGLVNNLEVPKTSTTEIYPNPSESGLFTINKSGNWEVYNLSGTKVKSGKDSKVDLSNQPQGTYLLKIDGETKKLVFQ